MTFDLWHLDPKTKQIISIHIGTLEPSMKLISWPVFKLSRERKRDGRTDGQPENIMPPAPPSVIKTHNSENIPQIMSAITYIWSFLMKKDHESWHYSRFNLKLGFISINLLQLQNIFFSHVSFQYPRYCTSIISELQRSKRDSEQKQEWDSPVFYNFIFLSIYDRI